MARHRVTWTHRTLVGVDEERGADVYEEELQEHDVEAEGPEQAAAEALLGVYGALRPAMAPERVEVDGVAFDVEEWLDALVHVVRAGEGPDPRRAVERARAGVRLARAHLARLERAPGPDGARAAAEVRAELGPVEARIEVLRARDDAHRLADDLRSGAVYVAVPTTAFSVDLDADRTARVAELLERLRDLLAEGGSP